MPDLLLLVFVLGHSQYEAKGVETRAAVEGEGVCLQVSSTDGSEFALSLR